MAELIKTKRGLDIPIIGKAKETIVAAPLSPIVSVVPDYYHGIIPKIMVKEGSILKAGSPVFYNKAVPEMNFVSPVSGKVIAVNRGERRKLLSITIAPDSKNEYESFTTGSPSNFTAEEIKSQLLTAGLWPYIKQRPYDVIANPLSTPKAIFISSFDSVPLAPDYDFIMKGQTADFQTGIDALAKLSSAKIQLAVKAGNKSTEFRSVKNVEITEYEGPHPIGNVGIQINHISPINKGEVVWTVNVQDVLFIGRYFNKGIVDLNKIIAFGGPEVNEPHYVKTITGTSIQPIVKGKVTTEIPLRYISGNVLTGIKIKADGVLDPYANQITVIEEGSETHEMFGWALPRLDKFSTSNTYFTSLVSSSLFKSIFGKIKFKYDARLMGGVRAIIMSNEYERVLPMDILPEFLIKAMIAGNIDKMETLGAYEIAPEDVAICEFVCTSKLPLQAIVRNALDIMKSELE